MNLDDLQKLCDEVCFDCEFADLQGFALSLPKLIARVKQLEAAAKDARDIIDSLSWATDTTNRVIKQIDAILSEGEK